MSRYRRLVALTAGCLIAMAARAQDPKSPADTKAFDKVLVDTLREAHNKGADLYNEKKDYDGAYRLYQGSLITVRPLLAHRPEAQKLIDDGLSAADKESDPALRAFKLHETIEAVRTHLKDVILKGAVPMKPVEPPMKPVEPPKKPVDPPKKPDDMKKPVVPPEKPKPSGELAPPPRQVKPKPTTN